MGITKFISFITKASTDIIEDNIPINNETKKFVGENIIFDISFIIYNSFISIDNDINDYIKIKLSMLDNKNNNKNIELLEKMLNNIKDNLCWKNFNFKLLDNYIDDGKNIDISIFDNVIILKLIYILKNILSNLYFYKYIKNVNIIFDGIPSLSKIIEQRRRKIKNNIDNIEKNKIIKSFYNDEKMVKLINNLNNKLFIYEQNENYNILFFDLINWQNKKINLDKKIYPGSNFILKLEKFLTNNINTYIDNIVIILQKSYINGEADFKIFKYISCNIENNVYYIHTSDSDIIYISMIQQIYYWILNRNIKLIVIKHITIDNKECVNYFNISNMIYNIYNYYNIKVNKEYYNNDIKTMPNNEKLFFLWDIFFIFLFFGNDHITQCIDLSIELDLDFYILRYHEVFNKNINTSNIIIIQTINKIRKTIINFNNLLLYLENINNYNKINKTKIILQKFFKININAIKLYTDNFNFSFDELLCFLKNFIMYKAFKLSDNEFEKLYDDDLRKIYVNEFNQININSNIDDINILKNSYLNFSIFNLSENNINILIANENIIELSINYFEHLYNGLTIQKKNFNISDNEYNLINNILYDEKYNNMCNMYSYLYDNINIEKYLNNNDHIDESIIEHYIENIIHLSLLYFSDMKYYHSDNIFYYNNISYPKLNDIINYLRKKQYDKKYLHNIILKLKKYNLTKNNYMMLNNHNKLLLDEYIYIFNDYENYRNINIIEI